MLVPEERVREWYKTTSPIYQNFAFWFDNPLWKKRIPNGFSVCPFFWLSMLGLFGLKPTIWFVVKVIQPLLGLLGKPFQAYDAMVRQKFLPPNANHTGAGILASLAACGVGAVLTGIGFMLHRFHQLYVQPYAGDQFLFYDAVGGGLALVALMIYGIVSNANFKLKPYVAAWIISFVVGAIISYPSLIIAPFYLIVGLLYMIGKFLLFAAWVGLTFTVGGIFWWLWVALPIAGLFFLMNSKFLDTYFPASKLEDVASKPVDNYSYYKAKLWKHFGKYHVHAVYHELRVALADTKQYAELETTAGQYVARACAEQALADVVDRLAIALRHKPIPNEGFKGVKFNERLDSEVLSLATFTGVRAGDMSIATVIRDIMTDDPETMLGQEALNIYKGSEMRELYKSLTVTFSKRDERKEYYSKTLEQVGEVLTRICAPVVRKSVKVGGSLWTFACYMVTLVKAKKKGACPYFMFEKTEEPK